MKTVLLLAGLSTCSAFAPVAQNNAAASTVLGAAAELDGMIGVDVETGKKVVRTSSRVVFDGTIVILSG